MNTPSHQHHPASFLTFLSDHRDGQLLDELTDVLGEVVAGVLDTRKTGSITLTVKIAAANEGNVVFVTDAIRSKTPERDRGGSIWFADNACQLVSSDPNQTRLSLPEDTVLDASTGEVIALR